MNNSIPFTHAKYVRLTDCNEMMDILVNQSKIIMHLALFIFPKLNKKHTRICSFYVLAELTLFLIDWMFENFI